MSRIFIDGGHGTVGRNLKDQLIAAGLGAQVNSIPYESQKNTEVRTAAMRSADLVVVCVPDQIAPGSVALIKEVNPHARILDASAAHRCDPNWVYGLPEVTPRKKIQEAQFVSNPGCFATGCILLGLALRKSPGHKAVFYGVTGTSAAGNKGSTILEPVLTQIGSKHRHLPEIQKYGLVTPILSTFVGPWDRGMLVQTHADQSVDDTKAVLHRLYSAHPEVQVSEALEGSRRLEATCCNGTNKVQITFAGHPNGGVVLACAFDNLGKGSAGAAVENIKIMLGY